MKPSRPLAALGLLVALLGASGCVWDRGMHQRDQNYGHRGQNGHVPNSYQRDRDGRPCTGPVDRGRDQDRDHDRDRDRDGDERHDQDCRAGGR